MQFASQKRAVLYEKLRERDGLICGICGGSLKESWKKYQEWVAAPAGQKPKRKHADLTIDHKYPKSRIRRETGFVYHRGWAWENEENLQLAHWECNNKKADK